MKDIKCIIFPSPDKPYRGQFESLTKMYETFFVEKEKCEFMLSWKHNESHLTTRCHYNYILPELSKLLNFDYNKDDFQLVKKFDNTNTYDLSYFVPKNDKKFRIHYSGKDKIGNYNELIGYTHYRMSKKYFYENTSFVGMNPDYHLLFFAPHQCCIIKNLCESNGRKLLISGDSQFIPIVPILAYYFQEVVYLDKRVGDYKEEYFDIDVNDYDILYAMSKYPLDKYEISNIKKISNCPKIGYDVQKTYSETTNEN